MDFGWMLKQRFCFIFELREQRWNNVVCLLTSWTSEGCWNNVDYFLTSWTSDGYWNNVSCLFLKLMDIRWTWKQCCVCLTLNIMNVRKTLKRRKCLLGNFVKEKTRKISYIPCAAFFVPLAFSFSSRCSRTSFNLLKNIFCIRFTLPVVLSHYISIDIGIYKAWILRYISVQLNPCKSRCFYFTTNKTVSISLYSNIYILIHPSLYISK